MVNHFIQERQNQKTHTYLLYKPRLLIESLFSLVFKRFSLLILIVKTPWIEYPFVKVVMDYHYCFILGWSLKVATWMIVCLNPLFPRRRVRGRKTTGTAMLLALSS